MGWTVVYKCPAPSPSFQIVAKKVPPVCQIVAKNTKNSVTIANLQTYISVFITNKAKTNVLNFED